MLTVNFSPFPTLTTARLTLRQLTSDDKNDFFRLRSDKEIMKFIARPLAKSMDDATRLIQTITDNMRANKHITWAITLKDSPVVIGTIGYVTITPEHHRAEIGYLLDPDYQKRGIMQEALTAALQYGFNTMQLHSVEAIVNPANAASINLLEKANFIREAHFRDYIFYESRFIDSAIYRLIAPGQT